jgi:hypothetical protein
MPELLPKDLSRSIVVALRRATLILLIDRLTRIAQDTPEAILPVTWDKVARAAVGCNLIGVGEVQQIRSIINHDNQEWRTIVSFVEHQLSYLRAADAGFQTTSTCEPRAQLAADPRSYAGFLAGVAASHSMHAEFVASISELASARLLVDLGGGFGAYSAAWIHSQPSRRAILTDLSDVEAILPSNITENSRIAFGGLDLLERPLALPRGDVYLLANVLHLFQHWDEILSDVAESLPPKAILVIMEASSTGNEGALFDLQVHIRSGFLGGLIDHERLTIVAARAGLKMQHEYQVSDEKDVFRRNYYVNVFVREGD